MDGVSHGVLPALEGNHRPSHKGDLAGIAKAKTDSTIDSSTSLIEIHVVYLVLAGDFFDCVAVIS